VRISRTPLEALLGDIQSMGHDSRSKLLLSARLVLITGVAGILAGVVGILFARDVHWIRVFDNLHWTAGTVTAAVLAWFGVRLAHADSVQGLRWIAVGLTAYAIGQIIWDVQTFLGYGGFPSPSDLFYLLLGPFVALGLLVESLRLADRIQRKTLLLDAATLGIAVTTLVLVLYLPRRGDTALLPLAVMVAYPASQLAARVSPGRRTDAAQSFLELLAVPRFLMVTGVC
jgi:hypothetical protein